MQHGPCCTSLKAAPNKGKRFYSANFLYFMCWCSTYLSKQLVPICSSMCHSMPKLLPLLIWRLRLASHLVTSCCTGTTVPVSRSLPAQLCLNTVHLAMPRRMAADAHAVRLVVVASCQNLGIPAIWPTHFHVAGLPKFALSKLLSGTWTESLVA